MNSNKYLSDDQENKNVWLSKMKKKKKEVIELKNQYRDELVEGNEVKMKVGFKKLLTQLESSEKRWAYTLATINKVITN